MGATKISVWVFALCILNANAGCCPPAPNDNIHITTEDIDLSSDSDSSSALIKDEYGVRGYQAQSEQDSYDQLNTELISNDRGTSTSLHAQGSKDAEDSYKSFSISADGREKSQYENENAESESYDAKKFEFVGADGSVVKTEETNESEESASSTSESTVIEEPVPPPYSNRPHAHTRVDVELPGSEESDWQVIKYESIEGGRPCITMKIVPVDKPKSSIISSSSSKNNSHHSSKSSKKSSSIASRPPITPRPPVYGPPIKESPVLLGPPIRIRPAPSPVIINKGGSTLVGSATTGTSSYAGPDGASQTSGSSADVATTDKRRTEISTPGGGGGYWGNPSSGTNIVNQRDSTSVSSASSGSSSYDGPDDASQTSGSSAAVATTDKRRTEISTPGGGGGYWGSPSYNTGLVDEGDSTSVSSAKSENFNQAGPCGASQTLGSSATVATTDKESTEIYTPGQDGGYWGYPSSGTYLVDERDSTSVSSANNEYSNLDEPCGASQTSGSSADVAITDKRRTEISTPGGGGGYWGNPSSGTNIVNQRDSTSVSSASSGSSSYDGPDDASQTSGSSAAVATTDKRRTEISTPGGSGGYWGSPSYNTGLVDEGDSTSVSSAKSENFNQAGPCGASQTLGSSATVATTDKESTEIYTPGQDGGYWGYPSSGTYLVDERDSTSVSSANNEYSNLDEPCGASQTSGSSADVAITDKRRTEISTPGGGGGYWGNPSSGTNIVNQRDSTSVSSASSGSSSYDGPDDASQTSGSSAAVATTDKRRTEISTPGGGGGYWGSPSYNTGLVDEGDSTSVSSAKSENFNLDEPCGASQTSGSSADVAITDKRRTEISTPGGGGGYWGNPSSGTNIVNQRDSTSVSSASSGSSSYDGPDDASQTSGSSAAVATTDKRRTEISTPGGGGGYWGSPSYNTGLVDEGDSTSVSSAKSENFNQAGPCGASQTLGSSATVATTDKESTEIYTPGQDGGYWGYPSSGTYLVDERDSTSVSSANNEYSNLDEPCGASQTSGSSADVAITDKRRTEISTPGGGGGYWGNPSSGTNIVNQRDSTSVSSASSGSSSYDGPDDASQTSGSSAAVATTDKRRTEISTPGGGGGYWGSPSYNTGLVDEGDSTSVSSAKSENFNQAGPCGASQTLGSSATVATTDKESTEIYTPGQDGGYWGYPSSGTYLVDERDSTSVSSANNEYSNLDEPCGASQTSGSSADVAITDKRRTEISTPGGGGGYWGNPSSGTNIVNQRDSTSVSSASSGSSSYDGPDDASQTSGSSAAVATTDKRRTEISTPGGGGGYWGSPSYNTGLVDEGDSTSVSSAKSENFNLDEPCGASQTSGSSADVAITDKRRTEISTPGGGGGYWGNPSSGTNIVNQRDSTSVSSASSGSSSYDGPDDASQTSGSSAAVATTDKRRTEISTPGGGGGYWGSPSYNTGLVDEGDSTSVSSAKSENFNQAGPCGASQTLGSSATVATTDKESTEIYTPGQDGGYWGYPSSGTYLVDERDSTSVSSANNEYSNLDEPCGASQTSGSSADVAITDKRRTEISTPGGGGGYWGNPSSGTNIVNQRDSTSVSSASSGSSSYDGPDDASQTSGSSAAVATTDKRRTEISTPGGGGGYWGSPSYNTGLVDEGDSTSVSSAKSENFNQAGPCGASQTLGSSATVATTDKESTEIYTPGQDGGYWGYPSSDTYRVDEGDSTSVGSAVGRIDEGSTTIVNDWGGPVIDWSDNIDDLDYPRPNIIPRRRPCYGSICICYRHIRDIPRNVRRCLGIR